MEMMAWVRHCGHVAMLLLATAGGPASGAPLALRPGMGGVADFGAIRCETLTVMYPAGPNGVRQAVLYWTEGYVYARTGQTMDAFLARRPHEVPWDFERLTGHVVAFCAAQPDALVAMAVEDLWVRLGGASPAP